MPVFMSGNFSVALHDFIETLKFAVRKISANRELDAGRINICSIRGGNIFGEHEVIFANCKDEVVTFRHQVSSRETFADGAVEVSLWTDRQQSGLFCMDDFCNREEGF